MVNSNGRTLLKKKKKLKFTPTHIVCYITVLVVASHWLFINLIDQISAIITAISGWDPLAQDYYVYPISKIFTNFKTILSMIFTDPEIHVYYLRGIYVALLDLPTIFIPVFVSFILYKKVPLSGFWTIVLFVPSAFSSLMMSMSFKYFMEEAIPGMIFEWTGKNIGSIFFNKGRAFWILIFYKEFFSLSAGYIVNIGTLKKIPDELLDVGKLSGLTMWQEFWYIGFPCLYKVLSMGWWGILGSLILGTGLPIYEFYADRAYDYDLVTMDYYIFTSTLGQGTTSAGEIAGYSQAWGYISAIISLTCTLISMRVFDKLDPGWEV